MKKVVKSLFLVALGIISFQCLATVSSMASAKDAIELRFSTFFPPQNPQALLYAEWIKEVEKRSNGKVKITFYPGASLVAPDKTHDGIVHGITDIGTVFKTNPGRYPATEMLCLPQNYPDGYVSTRVAHDFYNEFETPDFKDVKYLNLFALGPIMPTTKKPVHKLEDLKGMVFRAGGPGIGSKIMKTLKVQLYNCPITEAYEAISKGIVDGNSSPPEALKAWKFGKVLNYLVKVPEIAFTDVIVTLMNKKKFDSLPEDIQQVLMEVSEEWVEKHARTINWQNQQGIDFLLSQGDDKGIIELEPDEAKRWVAAIEPVLDGERKKVADKGHPVEEWQTYISERIAHWSKNAPSAGEINAWYDSELKPLELIK